MVLSEFGGYVWKDEKHSFNPDKTYGYRIFKTRAEKKTDGCQKGEGREWRKYHREDNTLRRCIYPSSEG